VSRRRTAGIIEAMPSTVRALVALLYATAAATVAVEVLNWAYAPEQEFGLAVRTGWAMLRSLGFLILVWHVRRGRAGAKPFGLILAFTTVFAVGRLVVPRSGVPPLPGVLGFAVLTALCISVVVLLYRAPAVQAHLVNHPGRLVVDKQGIGWRSAPPARPPVAAWLLTARIAVFTYAPLMLVPTLVSMGVVFGGRASLAPLVIFWLVFGIVVANLLLPVTVFLMRGKTWPRPVLVVLTLAVLAVSLPMCGLLLGLDGLIRDGAPLVVAAVIALVALWRAGRAGSAPSRPPVAAAAR
jgi:hypothetical protein